MIMKLLAQTQTNIGNISGIGPLGLENTPTAWSTYVFSRTVSVLVGVMTIFASIWFMILLITSAYKWMNAGGDKAALEEARQKMLHGIIGLTIVVSSIFLVDLIGEVLGIPYILDPFMFFNAILNP